MLGCAIMGLHSNLNDDGGASLIAGPFDVTFAKGAPSGELDGFLMDIIENPFKFLSKLRDNVGLITAYLQHIADKPRTPELTFQMHKKMQKIGIVVEKLGAGSWWVRCPQKPHAKQKL